MAFRTGTLDDLRVIRSRLAAAGIETLKHIMRPGFYDRLETVSARLAGGLSAAAREAGVPVEFWSRVGD